MTKEEILNGMSEEEFYNLYPTEEAYFMAKGGSLSGAPHNGQPTADEFFSYGAPAFGHMNIPMSNPTYLAHGGTYFGGPIRPYAYGGLTKYQGDVNGSQVNPWQTPGSTHPDDPNFIHSTTSGSTRWVTKEGKTPFQELLSKPKMYGSGKWTGQDTLIHNDPRLFNIEKAISEKPEYKSSYWGAPILRDLDEVERAKAYEMTYGAPNSLINRTGTAKGTNPDPYDQMYYDAIKGNDSGTAKPVSKELEQKLRYYSKAKKYGGYMDMGGYNSPTNYGSFSVPMDMGGEEDSNDPPKFVPLSKKDSAAVTEKLKYIDKRYPENKYEFLFTDTTETDIRPFNKKLNKFERLSDNLQWDPKKRLFGDNEKWINHKAMQEKLARQAAKKNEPSLRPSPFAETWNLLKRQEEERLRRAAEQKEYGGILDANNNQDYPMMNQGGMDAYAFGGNYDNLRSFLKTVSKANKKAFGGDKTIQGGNQDYITERKNIYDTFLKQNVYNSLVDQEEEDISKAFMRVGGLPKAQYNNQSPILNPLKPVQNAGVFPNTQNMYSLPQQTQSFTTPESIGQNMGPTMEMKGQTNNVVPEQPNGVKTVQPSNWEEKLSNALLEVGKESDVIANKWAERLENKPSEVAKTKDIMNRLITPGSDLSSFQAKPANAMSRGDYDPNSGMFRPNDMVPIQFPGGMYGAYGGSFQNGGMYEEGEELDLSQEEIDELRNLGYEIEELD
jgi:hypothetical protein